MQGSGCRLILEAFGSQPNLLLTDTADGILKPPDALTAAAARPCFPALRTSRLGRLPA
jgi:hypothetical protein